MRPDCLFCSNSSGSNEHLWAAWIHRRKDFGPLKVKIGNLAYEIRTDPEQKITTVCGKCNNGWMSVLENNNKSVIASIFEDLAIPLDVQQQTLLSNWAVKSAMVLDSIKEPTANPRFYLKSDCVGFGTHRIIPHGTRVWIGRSSINALGAYGTDVGVIFPGQFKTGIGSAITIVVGHLAIQVFARRFNPAHAGNAIEVQPKPGNWDKMLVPIWPVGRDSVMWPPEVTFTASGPRSIATLMDRWRIGIAVLHTPTA